MQWTSYNYPSIVVSGSYSGTFFYGPDRQRYFQTVTDSNNTEQTTFIGKELELTYAAGGATTWRHYVYAGGTPVAVIGRATNGGNWRMYILGDRQGSVSSILNGTSTFVKESFSAFGLERNAADWSTAVPAVDASNVRYVSRHGYGFQTVIGQPGSTNALGIIHMNGRVEDAVVGRFLSADPNIPDPTNTQSYNRYSYTNNNPLTMVDPTGFDDKSEVNDGGGGTFGSGDGGDGGDGGGGGGGGQKWPGQWAWYCYGNCGSGVWANSITQSVPNPVYSAAVRALLGISSQGTSSLGINDFASAFNDALINSTSQGNGLLDMPQGNLPISPDAVVVQASSRIFPVDNPGWDVVGLDFINGIESNDARYLTHIRPRHASNAPFSPAAPNGRFLAPILSLSTPKDQFDAELGLLFNQYTPSFFEPTNAGLALEFVLPAAVGLDLQNAPTNSWTVILSLVGSGIYQIWTTYPGHPVLGN